MTSPRTLRLFLDRSTQGRRFVAAVRDLVDDVETIVDRYGPYAAPGVADVRWIADATVDGRVLVGADRYILRNRLERRAVCMHRARYVVFGTNNLPVAMMIELFRAALPTVIEHIATPGPWVLRIARHGTERLSLNCDDVLRP